jgi:hypothetical protein
MVAVLCFVCGASVGLAQGVYLTANAGYSLGAGTQTLGSNYTSTGATYSYEGVYGSYGEGFKFGASAGYMFSKNLGAELGLSYWLGNTFKVNYKTTTSLTTIKYSGSGFVAVPSIVVSANMEGINPYARFGLVLGILKVKQQYRSEQSGNTTEYTAEDTGNLALGYAGALGVLVPSGGTLDFFAEAALHSVNYSPSQSEITKYTVNGIDGLASLTQKVTEYKDTYTSSTTPSTMLSVRRPFSSIGMVVGVRINL